MASIVVAGDTSGTVTLAAPAIAGTPTLTLPTTSGTILTSATPFSNGQGPAFSAKLAADQTGLSNAVWTKVQAGLEQFDTANCYDTSLFRFTPNVAGYYLITGNIGVTPAITGQFIGAFYRNGSSYNVFMQTGDNRTNCAYSGSIIMFFNGSTDYVEMFAYVDSSGGRNLQSESGLKGYFTGCLVRPA